MVSVFRPDLLIGRKPHPSQVKLARLRTESRWKTRGRVLSHCLQPSRKVQQGIYLCAMGRCVCIRRATGLIGDARHAKGEGKSGPVETRLSGPMGTALLSVKQ